MRTAAIYLAGLPPHTLHRIRKRILRPRPFIELRSTARRTDLAIRPLWCARADWARSPTWSWDYQMGWAVAQAEAWLRPDGARGPQPLWPVSPGEPTEEEWVGGHYFAAFDLRFPRVAELWATYTHQERQAAGMGGHLVDLADRDPWLLPAALRGDPTWVVASMHAVSCLRALAGPSVEILGNGNLRSPALDGRFADPNDRSHWTNAQWIGDLSWHRRNPFPVAVMCYNGAEQRNRVISILEAVEQAGGETWITYNNGDYTAETLGE